MKFSDSLELARERFEKLRNRESKLEDFGALFEEANFMFKLVEAYREVAILAAYDPWSRGEKHFERGPAEKQIDEMAQRIFEEQKKVKE